MAEFSDSGILHDNVTPLRSKTNIDEPYGWVNSADTCREIYNQSNQKINDVLATASMLAQLAAESGKRTCEVYCPSDNIYLVVQRVLKAKGFKFKNTIQLKEGFNFIIEF